MDLTDPVSAAILAADALGSAGIPHALYGGLLLAAYGHPRETRDADIAVVDADAAAIGAALGAAGIEVRPVFTGVVFGALSIDRFTLLGAPAATGLNTLDAVRPRSVRYRGLAVARAVSAPLRDRPVPALTAMDFVLFKILSTRERDLEDAASVLEMSAAYVDREDLRREAALLASEIPDHEIRDRLTRLESMAGPATAGN